MLLSAGQAAPLLAELERWKRISLIEEPIMRHDSAGNRALRHKATTPLALHLHPTTFPGEVGGHGDDVCDGYVVAWQGVGGLLRMGALCEAFNKPFFLQMVGTGLTTALCAHLGSVLPMAQWPAITCLNIFADDLLREPLTIQGGALRVPTGPGLGIIVDEEALERYRVEPSYIVAYPPQILSVVWSGGLAAHYADIEQCWADFMAGNQPMYESGVHLELRPNDNSREWDDLRARVAKGPVREYGRL